MAQFQRSAKINHHHMTKHYVLVSVQVPTGDSRNEELVAGSFVHTTCKISDLDKGIRRLHENTWLIDKETSTVALGKIVDAAESLGLKHDVWYFSSE